MAPAPAPSYPVADEARSLGHPTKAVNDTKLHPCARCARMQQTCCQDTEVVITQGDRARLRLQVGNDDFWERKPLTDPEAAVFQPSDPNWQRLTVAADGTRMVLRHVEGANGRGMDCHFLGASGCVLDVEVRPLICRLYPFGYTESGITDVAANHCPTKVLLADEPAGATMADILDIEWSEAERWRALLYAELREDAAGEN